jgi:hypothetical protein
LNNAIPLIIQAGIELFLALIEALPQIIIELVKAAPKIITAIVKALAEGVKTMAEMGLNLIKACEGISDAASCYGIK